MVQKHYELKHRIQVITRLPDRISDVCLEAEVLPRGSKVLPLPRLDVLMPRLGLDVMASVSSRLEALEPELRYDIFINNCPPVDFLCICVYDKTSSMYKTTFLDAIKRVQCFCCLVNLV